MSRQRLLTVLVVMLVAVVGSGTAYAVTLMEKRDALIADLNRTNAQVADANVAFQAEVASLEAERSSLTRDLATVTADRNNLAAARDQTVNERDELSLRIGDLNKKVADLESQLAESDRQLSQTRQEGSRQQTRAEVAEANRDILAAALVIDDKIHTEFGVLLDNVVLMNQAYQRRDYVGGDLYYRRAEASMGRLEDLFAQRKQTLARLQ